MPICWIIAGPNGAGKTTFALEYLPTMTGCRNFINADLIAAGLSPLDPAREQVAASRLFLREIEQCISKREDFAFETTLAGRGYLHLIDRLQREGWLVELVYLALQDVAMSTLRVAERVAHGGHNIPTKDIARRFPRSLRNLLTEYSGLADRTRCFMNSANNPVPIFEQRQTSRLIHHEKFFQSYCRGGRLMKTLSPDTQEMLECLQAAVDKALEKKRRLGQYAVIWEDNKPVFIGDDAPQETGGASKQ